MFDAHAQTPTPATDAVPINPVLMLSRNKSRVVGFQKRLPTIFVALVAFAVVDGFARGVGRSFRAWSDRHDGANLAAVLASPIRWPIVLVGEPEEARKSAVAGGWA